MSCSHRSKVVARTLVVSLGLLAAACRSAQPPKTVEPPRLSPPETFDWSGQAVTFAPPSDGWRREGETGGGIKGARFVKERSVGEAIGVGDYYLLADRHRSAYLRDMLAKFDTYDNGFGWERALRGAYAHTDSPFSPLEAEVAESINAAVGQANAAFRTRDKDAARSHLESALQDADRLQFSLADVIDRVEFKPEGREHPEWYQLLARREGTIAGEPAIFVDYTVKTPVRTETFFAREAYVVHNSHLFIGTFIGLQETLSVFDAIIDSIEFPQQ